MPHKNMEPLRTEEAGRPAAGSEGTRRGGAAHEVVLERSLPSPLAAEVADEHPCGGAPDQQSVNCHVRQPLPEPPVRWRKEVGRCASLRGNAPSAPLYAG